MKSGDRPAACTAASAARGEEAPWRLRSLKLFLRASSQHSHFLRACHFYNQKKQKNVSAAQLPPSAVSGSGVGGVAFTRPLPLGSTVTSGFQLPQTTDL